MKTEDALKRLQDKFGSKITGSKLDVIEPWIEVAPAAIREVGLYCRDNPDFALDYLKDMSGVDWLVTDPKKAKKLEVEPHVEVIYHLFSFTHKFDLTLKVLLERWKDGKENELPEMPSVYDIWRIAEWHEREIYDLMGVRFTGHPGLRRILCCEDWVGHPLRKDYVFPLEYHGIRCQ